MKRQQSQSLIAEATTHVAETITSPTSEELVERWSNSGNRKSAERPKILVVSGKERREDNS